MSHDEDVIPALPKDTAPLADYQRFVRDLERFHGWLDVDLVHNCFLMGEEVGELFKAVRKANRLFDEVDDKEATSPDEASRRADASTDVAHEIVDVMNYLIAIANRLDIDLAQAFREKNAQNLKRTWKS